MLEGGLGCDPGNYESSGPYRTCQRRRGKSYRISGTKGPSRLGAGQGEGFWNESFGTDPQAGRDPGRLYPKADNPRYRMCGRDCRSF